MRDKAQKQSQKGDLHRDKSGEVLQHHDQRDRSSWLPPAHLAQVR